MKKHLIIGLTLLAVACGGKIYSDAEIQELCLAEKRSAEGPTGSGTISTGTNGTKVGLSISVSDKFVRGLDPAAVYETCIQKYNDHNARMIAKQNAEK